MSAYITETSSFEILQRHRVSAHLVCQASCNGRPRVGMLIIYRWILFRRRVYSKFKYSCLLFSGFSGSPFSAINYSVFCFVEEKLHTDQIKWLLQFCMPTYDGIDRADKSIAIINFLISFNMSTLTLFISILSYHHDVMYSTRTATVPEVQYNSTNMFQEIH